jgi:hypothetical protein
VGRADNVGLDGVCRERRMSIYTTGRKRRERFGIGLNDLVVDVVDGVMLVAFELFGRFRREVDDVIAFLPLLLLRSLTPNVLVVGVVVAVVIQVGVLRVLNLGALVLEGGRRWSGTTLEAGLEGTVVVLAVGGEREVEVNGLAVARLDVLGVLLDLRLRLRVLDDLDLFFVGGQDDLSEGLRLRLCIVDLGLLDLRLRAVTMGSSSSFGWTSSTMVT